MRAMKIKLCAIAGTVLLLSTTHAFARNSESGEVHVRCPSPLVKIDAIKDFDPTAAERKPSGVGNRLALTMVDGTPVFTCSYSGKIMASKEPGGVDGGPELPCSLIGSTKFKCTKKTPPPKPSIEIECPKKLSAIAEADGWEKGKVGTYSDVTARIYALPTYERTASGRANLLAPKPGKTRLWCVYENSTAAVATLTRSFPGKVCKPRGKGNDKQFICRSRVAPVAAQPPAPAPAAEPAVVDDKPIEDSPSSDEEGASNVQ